MFLQSFFDRGDALGTSFMSKIVRPYQWASWAQSHEGDLAELISNAYWILGGGGIDRGYDPLTTPIFWLSPPTPNRLIIYFFI